MPGDRSGRGGARDRRVVLHWFRRDLRLGDNTALAAAAREGDVVVPTFILDPHLLEAPDIGAPRVAFLLESLRALERDLARSGVPLIVRHGRPVDELIALARAVGASAIYANADYSPYATTRDALVCRAAEKAGLTWRTLDDQLLVPPGQCVKDDGTAYTVFTPFARRWRTFEKPVPLARPRLSAVPTDLARRAGGVPLPADAGALGLPLVATIAAAGERAAGRRLRSFLASGLERYRRDRDFPALEATSGLSPHLKFGCISARTVYAGAADAIGHDVAMLDPARPPRGLSAAQGRRLRESAVFVSQLCWREFYQTILYHFPRVTRGPFRERYARLRWPEARSELIEAWREGRTGFPIVDAAMRQLAATGWMHNRLRMVVAMFLTKTLLVDYRIGERIFMQRLVDGDVAANNGGWQWSASTGTDAAPYFRIFNPLSQSRRFDPDGAFIRRFVPELRDLPARSIHAPHEEPPRPRAAGYPPPCVDYAANRVRALDLFAARGTRDGRRRKTAATRAG
jgi:deoxyribodipyrimidine photo-lyase